MSEQDSAFPSVDGTSGLILGLGTLLPLSHVSKPNLNGPAERSSSQRSKEVVGSWGGRQGPGDKKPFLPWCSQTLSSVLAFWELRTSVIKQVHLG